MLIDSSSNLIIGTTTAATNAKVTVWIASPQLSLYATPGNVSRLTLGDTDDYDIGQIEYANSDNSMRFTTNASERLRIDVSVGYYQVLQLQEVILLIMHLVLSFKSK